MATCPHCGQRYNEKVNGADRCMACQGDYSLEHAGGLEDLPSYEVIEADSSQFRLRYADGSQGWAEDWAPDKRVGDPGGVARLVPAPSDADAS